MCFLVAEVNSVHEIHCHHNYVRFITFPALSTAETTSTFDPRVDPWLVLPSDRPSPKLLSLGRVNLTGGPWRTSSSLDCDLASDRRGASLPLLLLEATDPWQLEAEQEQTLEVSLDLFWWWPSLVTNSILFSWLFAIKDLCKKCCKKGTVPALKALQRSRTKIRELLEGTKENIDSTPMRGHWFDFSIMANWKKMS